MQTCLGFLFRVSLVFYMVVLRAVARQMNWVIRCFLKPDDCFVLT